MPAIAHPPGRLTLPSQPLTDKHFVYTPAMHTDIAHTIKRARERLLNQQLQADLREIAKQALLPGVAPAAKPVQRIRAGMQSPPALPSL